MGNCVGNKMRYGGEVKNKAPKKMKSGGKVKKTGCRVRGFK